MKKSNLVVKIIPDSHEHLMSDNGLKLSESKKKSVYLKLTQHI